MAWVLAQFVKSARAVEGKSDLWAISFNIGRIGEHFSTISTSLISLICADLCISVSKKGQFVLTLTLILTFSPRRRDAFWLFPVLWAAGGEDLGEGER